MESVRALLLFLLIVLPEWVPCRQLIGVEFLQAEKWMLKDPLRGKCIRFTDPERALLGR